MQDRHRQDRQSRVRDFLTDWARARAKFCSTADQSNLFVWPAWLDANDTGSRSVRFFPGKLQEQACSDSKWRSTSKWRLPPPCIARLRSRLFQSSMRGKPSNVFFWFCNWSDAGANPALRHEFFAINRFLTVSSKLRLLEPCGHDHGDEEQCGGEIIRRARQLK